MKLVILGSGCMFPTKERSQPAFFLEHEGSRFLFDAGEGVQRQIRIVGLSPIDIDAFFITHWHGDHSLGLAGMIQCMSGSRTSKPMLVFGPKGSKDKVNHLVQVFDFHQSFPIEVKDVCLPRGEMIEFYRINDLGISAFRLSHGSSCIGYCVKEDDKRRINVEYTKKFGLTQHPLLGKLQKGEDIVFEGHKITVDKGTYLKEGRKFCYVSDTSFFPELVDFVKGADLLVCESTYASDFNDKAELRNHMTASQAGLLAKKAGVKQLVLTHFSQRYTSVKQFVAEAGKHFKNVTAAKDFDVIEF